MSKLPEHEKDHTTTTHTWSEAVCLAALFFLTGAATAVQRPQGFLVVLFLSFGISEGGVGIMTVAAFSAASIGGPLLGWIADRLPITRRHWVFMATIILKGLFLGLVWPAILRLHGPTALWACVAAMSAASFWDGNGILIETTLRIVGAESFGRIRLWGGIGFAVGSVITGMLAELLPVLGLQVCFWVSAGLTLITMMVTFWLGHLEAIRPFEHHFEDALRELAHVQGDKETSYGGAKLVGAVSPKLIERRPQAVTAGEAEKMSPTGTDFFPEHGPRHVCRFLCSGMTPLFFLTVWALGIGEGTMQMYTYVRLKELPHGTSTVMGLSAVCMIASEVPFFYYSGQLVAAFGIMPILAVALLCQAVRQLWISHLWDALWVLPGELLHGITYSIANAALCTYVGEVAPLDLRNTGQAILNTVFSGFGQGGATILGAALIDDYGTAFLFRVSAILAASAAVLPATLAVVGDRRNPTRARLHSGWKSEEA